MQLKAAHATRATYATNEQMQQLSRGGTNPRPYKSLFVISSMTVFETSVPTYSLELPASCFDRKLFAVERFCEFLLLFLKIVVLKRAFHPALQHFFTPDLVSL